MMSLNMKLAYIGILLVIIGFLSGWLGCLFLGDLAGSVRVLFVSEEALVALEEERIKNLSENHETENSRVAGSIFFGKPELAIKKMEQIAGSFADKSTKVLIVSNKKGYARNGSGISDIIHKELVKVLSAEKEV
jgi:hypothetical protein